MELTKVKLSDVARVEISGVDKKSKPGQKSVRLCNFVDVYHNWAITQDMRDSFMEATASDKEIEALSIKKGQVAFTKDSETRDDIGIPTYIADDFDDVVLGYHNALITPDERKLNGKYLNAFMHSSYIQKYFENNASGSGQRYTLSNDTVNSIPILLPTIKEQEKIGNLFSFIDRKIALNKKMNQKLEAMAKRLYDYWFVQYDFPDKNGHPYKTTGGPMTYNPTLKREIPEGWEVKKVSDYADLITKGTTPSTLGFDFQDVGINFVKVECIENGQIRQENLMHISEEAHDAMKRSQLHGNDILVTIAGRLGSAAIVSEHILPANTNQAVALIRMKKEYGHLVNYIYRVISSSSMQKRLQGSNAQSIQKNLTLPILGDIEFVQDSNCEIIKRFNEITKPIFLRQQENIQEISRLTALRDKLLPLLMNGQVMVG